MMQNPVLARMHWEGQGHEELGPVRRQAELFPGVILLLKLRWLARLHGAICSFAGPRNGLQRILHCTLKDMCGVHDFCHEPGHIFDLLVEQLKLRLERAWPLFLAYVSTWEPGPSRSESVPSFDSLVSPQPSPRLQQQGSEVVKRPLPLMQIVDDIFIAWLVQQDPDEISSVAMLRELEFFGIPVPAFDLHLDGLRNWEEAKAIKGVQTQYIRQAQREAHHFTVLLESQALRGHWGFATDDTKKWVKAVLADRKLFNPGLRRRLDWATHGGSATAAAEPNWPLVGRISETQDSGDQLVASPNGIAPGSLVGATRTPRVAKQGVEVTWKSMQKVGSGVVL